MSVTKKQFVCRCRETQYLLLGMIEAYCRDDKNEFGYELTGEGLNSTVSALKVVTKTVEGIDIELEGCDDD